MFAILLQVFEACQRQSLLSIWRQRPGTSDMGTQACAAEPDNHGFYGQASARMLLQAFLLPHLYTGEDVQHLRQATLFPTAGPSTGLL
jgi:hypothetical protein